MTHTQKLYLWFALFAVLVFTGCWWLTYSTCGRVCEANGDENAWVWVHGCYCKDDEGIYNPKDSR